MTKPRERNEMENILAELVKLSNAQGDAGKEKMIADLLERAHRDGYEAAIKLYGIEK